MATPLLTRAREGAGLSRAELARRAHTSRTTVSAYEHGEDPHGGDPGTVGRAAGFERVLQPCGGNEESSADADGGDLAAVGAAVARRSG